MDRTLSLACLILAACLGLAAPARAGVVYAEFDLAEHAVPLGDVTYRLFSISTATAADLSVSVHSTEFDPVLFLSQFAGPPIFDDADDGDGTDAAASVPQAGPGQWYLAVGSVGAATGGSFTLAISPAEDILLSALSGDAARAALAALVVRPVRPLRLPSPAPPPLAAEAPAEAVRPGPADFQASYSTANSYPDFDEPLGWIYAPAAPSPSPATAAPAQEPAAVPAAVSAAAPAAEPAPPRPAALPPRPRAPVIAAAKPPPKSAPPAILPRSRRAPIPVAAAAPDPIITATPAALAPEPAPPTELPPLLPWPPPEPSARMEIPRARFLSAAGPTSLGDVDDRLRAALSANGYDEVGYFGVRDGFALVTRLERFEPGGASIVGRTRWTLEVPPLASFDLYAYVKALFTAQTGHFRVIAFVVTSAPFGAGDGGADAETLQRWTLTGNNALPVAVRAWPFGDGYAVTALVYEFSKVRGGRNVNLDVPSQTSALDHLTASRILAGLEGG